MKFEDFYKKCSELYMEFSPILENVEDYKATFGVDTATANKQVDTFREIRKDQSTKSSKMYVIEKYNSLLSKLYFSDKKRNVLDFIDFETFAICDYLKFELLLTLYEPKEMIAKYDVDYIFTSERLSEIFEDNKSKITDNFKSTSDRLYFLSQIIYSLINGQSVIDTLRFCDINEVAFASKDYIYIVLNSTDKYYLKFLYFYAIEDAIKIQIKLASGNSVHSSAKFNEDNPTLITEKNIGNRIALAGYSSTPESRIYCNERIFNVVEETMGYEFLIDLKTINEEDVKVINAITRNKFSYIISGSSMSVGKTTFLLSTVESIPQQLGIGVIDMTDETKLWKRFKDKNILTFIAKTEDQAKQYLYDMFKFSRDVVIVGEIIHGDHVKNLLTLANRLNCTISGTLHSKTAKQVPDNLVALMLDQGNLSLSYAQDMVANSLDFVYHMAKHPRNKKQIILQSIGEIVPVEEPDLKGDLRKLMSSALKKYLYNKPYVYKELAKYDVELGKLVPINQVSETRMEKLKMNDEEAYRVVSEYFLGGGSN